MFDLMFVLVPIIAIGMFVLVACVMFVPGVRS